jgi:hypothetical protein
VISHGFLRNLRSPWNSDLPAPVADEAAEAIGVGAVVGSIDEEGRRGMGRSADTAQRDKTDAGNGDGLGFLLGDNVGRTKRRVELAQPMPIKRQAGTGAQEPSPRSAAIQYSQNIPSTAPETCKVTHASTPPSRSGRRVGPNGVP